MKQRDFIQSAAVSGLLLSSPFALVQPKASPPKFSLQGTNVAGKKISLQDYAGHTVLLSFFTIDCEVCNHDIKLMREFYVRNMNKKFILIGVNLDQNKKELDEYNDITTLGYPKNQRFPTVWRNAVGHNDNFGKITTTPTHFVLDPKHQLMFKREGAFLPDDWDKLWLSMG